MTLQELDADETIALVALMKAIVLGDRNITAAEAEAVPKVIEALGYDRYRQAVEAAHSRFGDDEQALKSFLDGHGRPEARRLIHETVARLAKTDGVSPEEKSLLDWLAATWELEG